MAEGTNALKVMLGVAGGIMLAGCCGVGGCVALFTMSAAKVAEQQAKERAASGNPGPASGGARTFEAAPSVAGIGESVVFDDCDWLVSRAENLGQTASSNNQFQKPARTSGYFVQIKFSVTNRTKKEERIAFNPPVVVDSQGREFKHVDGESFYVPKGEKTLSAEALPPDITKHFYGVYEVPAGATGLKFRVPSMSLFGTKKLIDLGL